MAIVFLGIAWAIYDRHTTISRDRWLEEDRRLRHRRRW
jgi:hypothetical protein